MTPPLDPIADRVPYAEMQLEWISAHYDVPLAGLCWHQGRLCQFAANSDLDYYVDILYTIYPLSWIERINWRLKQRVFELFVGYHWSYPYRLQGVRYGQHRPRWLRKLLARIYYWKWRGMI